MMIRQPLIISAALLLLTGCIGKIDSRGAIDGKSTTPVANNSTSATTPPGHSTSPPGETTPAANRTTPEPPDPDYLERVGSVELTANVSTLTVGQGTALSVTVLDKEGAPMALEAPSWASTNERVAIAEGLGIIRALEEGTTSITATLGEVTSNAVMITVAPAPPVLPPTLRITPARHALAPGQRAALTESVRQGGKELLDAPHVTWRSGDDAIATIDEEGHVTAIAPGTTHVWAEYEGVQSAWSRVIVTNSPDYAAVDFDIPTSDVTVQGELAIQASFKKYRTGKNPGKGVPYRPESVDVMEADQVIATITPDYGLAVGRVDLSALSPGAHTIRLRARLDGQDVYSPTLQITRRDAPQNTWQDIGAASAVEAQHARLSSDRGELTLIAHTCARECSLIAYTHDASNDRWEKLEYRREYHRDRDGAIETSENRASNVDLPVYVGWGWPSADARHLHTPDDVSTALYVAFGNKDAFKSFNDESLPDHYWFDCHVARWNPSAGNDSLGGWDLLSGEDPDYLYKLPHPSTIPDSKQRHPVGVNAVRREDCAHPRVLTNQAGEPTVAHLTSVVPGAEHSVAFRRWDGSQWQDASAAIDIVANDPVLHDFVQDSNGQLAVSVDETGGATVWRLGMNGEWSRTGGAAEGISITSLDALDGGGLLGGSLSASGDATVHLATGNQWSQLGQLLDVSPWSIVTELEVLAHGGEFFVAWIEGPERGNHDAYVARWIGDEARWEVIGSGPLDANLDEDVSDLQIAIDSEGHMLVRYTVTYIEQLDLGVYSQSAFTQRVRRSTSPVITAM